MKVRIPPSLRRDLSIYLVYVVVAFPLCFLGYGADNDTYGVLDAGYSTWHQGVPETSRNPGYWLYEAATYVLNRSGGYFATNLASLICGAIVLWFFLKIAKRLDAPDPRPVAFCLMATPVFLIACSSTIDYAFSLVCMIASVEMLLDGRPWLAGILGAAAIAFRPSNAAVLAGGYAALLIFDCAIERGSSSWLRIFGSGLIAAVLGAAPCYESWRVAGSSLGFLAPMIGDPAMWTPWMRIGRFLYKSIYLLGPIASCLFVASLIRWRAEIFALRERGVRERRRLFTYAGIVVANGTLFFVFPIEISYLIPGLFFLFVLAAVTNLRKQQWAWAVALAIVFEGIVTISFARPNIAGRATSAKFEISAKPGELVESARLRRSLIGCESYACWDDRVSGSAAKDQATH